MPTTGTELREVKRHAKEALDVDELGRDVCADRGLQQAR
jgi:hypothetical protein